MDNRNKKLPVKRIEAGDSPIENDFSRWFAKSIHIWRSFAFRKGKPLKNVFKLPARLQLIAMWVANVGIILCKIVVNILK